MFTNTVCVCVCLPNPSTICRVWQDKFLGGVQLIWIQSFPQHYLMAYQTVLTLLNPWLGGGETKIVIIKFVILNIWSFKSIFSWMLFFLIHSTPLYFRSREITSCNKLRIYSDNPSNTGEMQQKIFLPPTSKWNTAGLISEFSFS